MRLRRDRDDNVDLSDEEHAWWTGRDRRKEAGHPPLGVDERRRHDTLTLVATPPPPPPPPPPSPPTVVEAPAAPSAPAPALVPTAQQVSADPAATTRFPFEQEAGSPTPADPAVQPEDPWHRSTSPEARAAYRALGIDWEATWDEVVEVFRDHAALWHPDRLAGTDPLVQAEGQRRMSEMNRAYAELKRRLRPSRRELFSS